LTVKPRGRLILDAGARQALENKGKSLLAIGIVGLTGSFVKGDVVALVDPDGREFARGLTNYGTAEIGLIKGQKTEKIGEILGYRPYDEVIHRDNMVVTHRKEEEKG
jgi:glutamate 5-kinase